MKIVRICLHSVILAFINISFILTGFRIYKSVGNEIARQAPITASLCILACIAWMVFIRRFLSVKKFSLQGWKEFVGVYIGSFVCSPLIFAPLHTIRWGYLASSNDFLSIWLFQLLVNVPALLITYQLVFKNARTPQIAKQSPPPEHDDSRQSRKRMEKQRHQMLPNLLLATASGVFSLIIVELMLQGFYEPPKVLSGWRSYTPPVENNQLGFRGQPIEYSNDDFVILLLGDSQVEALACAYTWMPERRLQHHLNSLGKNIKVFTLGAGGYGQDQQLLALQEYYQTYRADMVVLWQTPENDIWNNMFPTHWPANRTPKPTFWLENGNVYGPSEQMGEVLAIPKLRLGLLWQWILGHPNRDKQWERYLPAPYVPMTHFTQPANPDWQERWDANQGTMRDESLQTEKSHLAIWLTPRSKRMQYGIELTHKLLQRISDMVIDHHGKFVIFRTDRTLKKNMKREDVYVLHEKYYQTSIQQFEANVNDMNQGFFSYLIPLTTENWVFGPSDTHLNEHANDQVMYDLAKKTQSLVLSVNQR